jgi:G3E family GTPase
LKVISIIGLLGAGKSSLIKALLAEAEVRELRSGVLVNESGEVALDVPEVTDKYPVSIMGGG